uniref:G-protein coupled receptors family 1 profile domain-containing protein n=1 Tax=Panagrolaimus sp. ES5 TaxID=591445 RepID=A0AC34GQQ9_9BILA
MAWVQNDTHDENISVATTIAADTTGLVMYPSLKEPDTAVFTVASIYLICFVIGICGNASTLTVIFGLGTPQAIVDSLIGFWIFGTAACKIHHLFGSVGRIASTLLITAMSIDRYLIVAYPQTFGTRSAKTTTIVVGALFGLAFAVLLPLLIFAQAQSLVVYQGNHSTAGHLTIRVFKCVDGVVYVSYVDLFESRELRELTNASEKTMLILYCAHIFPYINTAVNWFLYGRLASNLSRTRQSNTTIQCSNSRNGIFPGSENSPPIRIRTGIPLSSSAGDTQNLLSHPEAIIHNSEVTRNGDFWSTNVSKLSDIKTTTHHRKITS